MHSLFCSAQVLSRRISRLCVVVLLASGIASACGQTSSTPLFTVTTLTANAAGIAANCTNQSLSGASLDRSCSLSDAFAAAAVVNSGGTSTPNTINFASSLASVGSPGTIALATNYALPNAVTLQGLTSGSGYTQKNLITLSGGSLYNSTGMTATVNNLNFTNSSMQNYGTLTVYQSLFQNHTSSGYGGAIYSQGTLNVTASTFSGNSASYGGAIYATNSNSGSYTSTLSTATVTNSTFVSNTAGEGAAIYNGLGAVLVANGNTFTKNQATADGSAVYNTNGRGTPIITNSILSGDTGGNECGGVGCDDASIAYLVTGNGTSGESGNIVMNMQTASGESYSVSVGFGFASTPESIAGGFGAKLSSTSSGISGQGIGPMFTVKVASGSPLTSVRFTNPSSTIVITKVATQVLSGSANVVGATTAAANLTPLGDHGGPVPTVLPLPGSAALCTSNPATAAGTDARGLPRTTTFGTVRCMDSGAVQTNYSLAFVQQPTNSFVATAITPAPTVQLQESGVNTADAGAPLTIAASAGTLSGTSMVTTPAGGLATFSGLSIGSVQTADTLIVSTPVGAYHVTATSSPFDVTLALTGTLTGNAAFPATAVGSSSTAQNFILKNTGSVTLSISAISVVGDYQSSTDCGSSLAAGASCSISIVFKPTATGTRTGTLSVGSNATIPSVLLTGTGVAQPSFVITDNATGSTTTSLTTPAGTPVSATLKLTSQNAFAGSVTLTCSAQGTVPAQTTCSVTSPATLAASGTAITTATFTTVARPASSSMGIWSVSAWPLWLLQATILLLPFRRMRPPVGRLRVIACAIAIVCLAGCSTPPTSYVSTATGTPAGTYTYLVTATSGTITATQTIQLTVK